MSYDMFSIGFNYGGPLLCNYVHWILMKSEEENVKHLYFIARDGLILKSIADVLIQKIGFTNIQTHYIYGSRVAWRVFKDRNSLLGLFDFFDIRSRYTIGEVIDLFKFPHQVFNGLELNKQVSGNYIRSCLFDAIENVPDDIIYEFFENQQKKENLIRAYFSQELPKEKEKFAFVDLQGSGRTINSLSYTLGSLNRGRFTCYYLYKTKRIFNEDNIKFESMLDDSVGNPGFLEMFARAPHAQTLGYHYSNNSVTPILGNEPLEITSESYEKYRGGVLEYVSSSVGLLKAQTEEAAALSSKAIVSDLFNNTKSQIYSYISEMLEYSHSLTGLSYESRTLSAYDRLKNRLVLYGAGKNGQKFYSQLKEIKDIVGWIDINADSFKNLDTKVTPLSSIHTIDFEQVLITVGSYDVAHSIRDDLMNIGVDSRKIIWFTFNEEIN